MTLIVTIDLDWAPEVAIEETLTYFDSINITPTVFITHLSDSVSSRFDKIEIGLHPYFSPESSHGSTNEEIAEYITNLPHNLKAYRCHRFQTSNEITEIMFQKGMLLSSNVCTDLELLPPFKNRHGLLEVPIFMEDGGYLFRNHPLVLTPSLKEKILFPSPKIILIHPMHFAINTPNFSYMKGIKRSFSRNEWQNMGKNTINKLRWGGHGIRKLFEEIFQLQRPTQSLGSLLKKESVSL